MSHVQKDNKAHGSHGNNKTSTKERKRAVKARGPFGENNETVQHRADYNPLSTKNEEIRQRHNKKIQQSLKNKNEHHKHLIKSKETLQDILSKTNYRIKEKSVNLKK